MRLFTTEVFLFALETATAPRRARHGFRLHVETRSDCLLHAHSLRFSRTDRLHPGPDGPRSQPLLYHSGSGTVNTFSADFFFRTSAGRRRETCSRSAREYIYPGLARVAIPSTKFFSEMFPPLLHRVTNSPGSAGGSSFDLPESEAARPIPRQQQCPPARRSHVSQMSLRAGRRDAAPARKQWRA